MTDAFATSEGIGKLPLREKHVEYVFVSLYNSKRL